MGRRRIGPAWSSLSLLLSHSSCHSEWRVWNGRCLSLLKGWHAALTAKGCRSCKVPTRSLKCYVQFVTKAGISVCSQGLVSEFPCLHTASNTFNAKQHCSVVKSCLYFMCLLFLHIAAGKSPCQRSCGYKHGPCRCWPQTQLLPSQPDVAFCSVTLNVKHVDNSVAYMGLISRLHGRTVKTGVTELQPLFCLHTVVCGSSCSGSDHRQTRTLYPLQLHPQSPCLWSPLLYLLLGCLDMCYYLRIIWNTSYVAKVN